MLLVLIDYGRLKPKLPFMRQRDVIVPISDDFKLADYSDVNDVDGRANARMAGLMESRKRVSLSPIDVVNCNSKNGRVDCGRVTKIVASKARSLDVAAEAVISEISAIRDVKVVFFSQTGHTPHDSAEVALSSLA